MHLQPRNSTLKRFTQFQNYSPQEMIHFPLHSPFGHHHLLSDPHFPVYAPHLQQPETLFNKRSLLNQCSLPPVEVKIEEVEAPSHLGFQPYEPLNGNSSTRGRAIEDSKANEVTQEETEKYQQKRIHQICWKSNPSQMEMVQIQQYRDKRKKSYLDKKTKRTFVKKIVYDTRKKVADRRIRFKGKFINELQARELLCLVKDQYSFEELKSLMGQLKKQSDINKI